MARTTLHVVPHTHWDREWYEPFEVYRFWLLKTLDRLIDVLERDPAFRHFHFDGQTAAVEDYLELRPERAGRVAALVTERRLAVGPWRILMDEFLCSPETIVRNIRQGLATARGLGGDPRLGTIPDSFGHVSQMPQILALAGMRDALVWRGVPSAVDRTVFWWESPDGTRMRTLYLATSYSNGATLPETFEELMVRAKRIAEHLAPFRPGEVLLAMNGSDHQGPQEHLPALFAEASSRQEEVELFIGSLAEYAARAPAGDDLPVWRGELRSGARANLLPGVASARIGLKQRELRASTLLERYAEPLSAIAGTDPGLLLERAWRWMVENSAHDSICGCGVDVVADQVAGRYDDAIRIAETVAADALGALAARVGARIGELGEGALVFNPSPRPRAGIAEITVPTEHAEALALRAPDGSLHPAQVLAASEEVVVDMTLTGQQLGRIVATMHSRKLGALFINKVETRLGRENQIRLHLGHVEEDGFDVGETIRAVEAVLRTKPRSKFHVLGIGPSVCRVLVRAPEIGGLGWTVLEPAPRGGTPVEAAARAEEAALDNGILRVQARADGAVDVLHHATGMRLERALALEDGGDAGDEYNYSPPERDLVVAEPDGPVTVEVIEEGPLRATLRVAFHVRAPAALDARGRARARRTVRLPVLTDLSLCAGEPFLRAAIRVENRAEDHRLRAVVPLPFAAAGSHADGAFHVVERGLEAEGGPHEHGLATYPSRRWVDVSDGRAGLAVMHRGTPEYEVLDGRALAVTLLRAVGWLSRQGMRYRAGPAGPAIPTPGAQCRGSHRFRLALYPHAGDWRAARVHDVAESYAYPLRTAPVRSHAGDLAPAAAPLTLAPESVQLSALHRDGDAAVLRVYNASPDAVEARVAVAPPLPAARAALIGLAGEELRPLEARAGEIALPLRGWEIATLRLS